VHEDVATSAQASDILPLKTITSIARNGTNKAIEKRTSMQFSELLFFEVL